MAQVVNWASVDISSQRLSRQLVPAYLTTKQHAEVKALIVGDLAEGHKLLTNCHDPDTSPDDLLVETAPVGRPGIVYVTAHLHCLASSVNGPHWLVDITPDAPRMLAGLHGEFEGWGLGVQQHRSEGLNDIVLGWFVDAVKMRLNYFSFDGIAYRKVSEREVVYCRSLSGHETETGRCYSTGQHALDSGLR
jgi:hypothetical protein